MISVFVSTDIQKNFKKALQGFSQNPQNVSCKCHGLITGILRLIIIINIIIITIIIIIIIMILLQHFQSTGSSSSVIIN